jgi:hypothetical protein
MSSDSKRGNPSIGAYENPYPFYVWTPVCDDIEGYETLQEAIDHAENYGPRDAPRTLFWSCVSLLRDRQARTQSRKPRNSSKTR